MEIEFKYNLTEKALADKLWEEIKKSPIALANTEQVVLMKAVYFDTEDGILSQNKYAFRLRAEGTESFATLKWKNTAKDGLHQRGELNIPIKEETLFIEPSLAIFPKEKEVLDLVNLIGEKKLQNILEMRFLRKRIKIFCQNSIAELAIDLGNIITDAGVLPISEMELELCDGKVEDLIKMGEELSKLYDLKPENRSKLERGINLLKNFHK